MKKTIITSILMTAILITAFAWKFAAVKTCEVEQKLGIYVFYNGQKPTDPYEYVGAVEAGGMVNYKPDHLVPQMIRKLKDKHPKADGIMFTEENNWKAEGIKFK